MAKMYPNRIPDDIARDRLRSAEIRIYETLAQQLPDAFACYYSRPWHRITPEGVEQDGEADFIIAHAQLGLLVIEVKGGRVSCREGDGQWISLDRHNIAFQIKNPVDQARRSKHHLIRRLNDSKDWRPNRFRARHAVILPDSSRPQRALGADAPLEIFAFGNDLASLGDWVQARMGAEGDSDGDLGRDGMEALHRELATKFELRPHLARSLGEDQRQIERLTYEQFAVLESLDGNAQMAISGAAGTGKTLLALEKAMRSAADGRRTLFTCYNTALGLHLKTLATGVENLHIGSFHQICGQIARVAGVVVSEAVDLYDLALPAALMNAVDAQPGLRFDSIIIDEGQDFHDGWLDTLRLCLKDPDAGEFYVFHDDNQRLYATTGGFLSSLPENSFRLNKNLRNTRAIYRSVTPWYEGRRVTSAGPEGEPVHWIECNDSRQAYAKAITLASELVRTRQVLAPQVTILTGKKRESCELFATGRVGSLGVVSAEHRAEAKSLTGDTVRRFKGLEAKCVILVDIDHLVEPELIYVALSRPSLLLYVVGKKEDIQRLKLAQV